jgi:protein-S-isoprenylcysteine O-methyltransferase Ste14
MVNEEPKETDLKKEQPKKNVHSILARSYFLFFLLFLVGVFLDLLFNLKIPDAVFTLPTGFILILFASLLILWSQKTSRNLSKENLSKENFRKGPYRFTRTPTHLGLFFLILGFGIIINATFIVLSTFISFILTKLIFLKEEEKFLEQKYGAPYLEYKKVVRF